ncbi:MAG: thiazole biosynthesis protein [Candidatus Methanoliparum thermophilum]|uniref:Thiamine thiazole synthase n=1 Tax=Methanoliparum thermophilum TaxID=2491083 RepID=A0A520KT40_METT2|nr:sulfide-dependent adenosine diphosphate thiazole synthase [Candidatus Methanoliparum sp. LAM-1]RZN65088.1 MAG: thiazole biosynthesis protein [Candidatus Methanoliparum thermophilum]BDC36019.1 ribose 1,5-bisphosphate isomerase [Candidatus Methanoliparum sp. LAM-1]
MIDEIDITRTIIEGYVEDFLKNIDIDVAIAGAGPSGMVAAYYLAKNGYHVVVFEGKLSIGGGMLGGGMMFSKIVIQEEVIPVIDEFGIKYTKHKNLYLLDALETASSLCLSAIRSGAKIFNLITVVDVLIRDTKIEGLVLNWSPIDMINLHIDPLSIRAKMVIDATGHTADIARIIEKKIGKCLATETGGLIGEKSMWAEKGEREIIGNTKEVYPGLVVTGMAANAVFGSPRMGAIFGGMLLSGKKAAEVVIDKLKSAENSSF